MPERVQAEYEAIPRTEMEPASFHQAAARVIGPWTMRILTVVIIILIVVMCFGIRAVNRFTSAVDEVVANQHESAVRGCVILAQDSEYLPPSCLDPVPINVYARDLIDALDTTGDQGRNRRLLCAALRREGVEDSDC